MGAPQSSPQNADDTFPASSLPTTRQNYKISFFMGPWLPSGSQSVLERTVFYLTAVLYSSFLTSVPGFTAQKKLGTSMPLLIIG